MDDTLIPPAKPVKTKRPRRQASAKGAARPSGRLGGCFSALFNLLTLLFVLLSCVAVLAVSAVLAGGLRFVPGGSAYMPPTDVPVAVALLTPRPFSAATSGPGYPTLPPVWTPSETPTITLTPLPATQSPIPSGTSPFPTDTPTRTPTATATATRPSPTPTRTGPTPKPTVTRSAFPYNLQAGSPTYLSNFLNTSGCNWFGIVGRAFGMDNNPVINLTVHLEGGGINTDVLTGTGPSALGPGGYQIPISDHPIDTTDVYHVQLRNNTGTPLSDIYSIRTYGDCPRNMVMVNFFQNH